MLFLISLFIFALTFHKCQFVKKAFLFIFDFWPLFKVGPFRGLRNLFFLVVGAVLLSFASGFLCAFLLVFSLLFVLFWVPFWLKVLGAVLLLFPLGFLCAFLFVFSILFWLFGFPGDHGGGEGRAETYDSGLGANYRGGKGS